MAEVDREINEMASSLATAILDVGVLKGDARFNAGVALERALKRFAELVIQRAREQQVGGST